MSGGDASPTVLTIGSRNPPPLKGSMLGGSGVYPWLFFWSVPRGSLSPYPLWLLNTVGVDLRVQPEPRKYKQRVLGRAF